MSDAKNRQPSWRERARPAEVLGLAAALAVFAGLVVLFSSRDLLLAVEFLGIAFVASVVVCATLLLAISKPEPPDDGPAAH